MGFYQASSERAPSCGEKIAAEAACPDRRMIGLTICPEKNREASRTSRKITVTIMGKLSATMGRISSIWGVMVGSTVMRKESFAAEKATYVV